MRQGSPTPQPQTSTRRELRLLCLVEQAPDGRVLCLPIHTLYRPQVPWAAVSHKWTRVLPAGFILRDTRATAPSPEALARCRRQHRADALGTRLRVYDWKPPLRRLVAGLRACDKERLDFTTELNAER